MKKIAIATLLAFAALSAGAQTIGDALQFSEYNYYGTARTIAMGNAFTALGGDLGSIGINPAGSAVAHYAQVTLTPNVSIVATGAEYSPTDTDFQSPLKSNRGRFTMPNFGVNMYTDLHKRSGLKGISFGFTGNATANYLDQVAAFGTNPHTSYLGQMAAGLKGISSAAFENNPYDNPDVYWPEVIGWRTGMIYNEDGTDDAYVGSTERLFDDGYFRTGGPLNQRWGRQTRGNRMDMVMNMGLNFSDRFFLGFNLGLVSLDMEREVYTIEEAVDPQDFPNNFEGTDTYFSSMRMRNYMEADGSGVYGKIGMIYVPVPELRLGAAIQTPTAMHIHEYYRTAGDISFTDSKFSASESSPQGEGEYRLTSPFRFNLGAAYNFGMGVVSADYEMADFSAMKLHSAFEGYSDSYAAENEDIRNTYGASHAIRLGFELKPMPEFALRAGYTLTTLPDKQKDKGFDNRQSASLGFGYSSPGAFFVDVAFRGSFVNRYQMLYDDYASVVSPTVKISNNLWDIVATFGWRF
ncbi:MAG: hypothetical protein IJ578_02225 [Bacteroidales bacterium]|nr:hypothetical protein [Bacteroidales bacterium]